MDCIWRVEFFVRKYIFALCFLLPYLPVGAGMQTLCLPVDIFQHRKLKRSADSNLRPWFAQGVCSHERVEIKSLDFH